MAKVLVLYYSSYGHIERMAVAEADGARSAGAEVNIKRVPELVPNKVALASHYKLDQIAPVANVDDLISAVDYGAPLYDSKIGEFISSFCMGGMRCNELARINNHFECMICGFGNGHRISPSAFQLSWQRE